MDCGLDAAFLDHQPKFSLVKNLFTLECVCVTFGSFFYLFFFFFFFFLYLFLLLDVTSCIDDVRSCSCVYVGLNVFWH
jgi:hypothetical protein